MIELYASFRADFLEFSDTPRIRLLDMSIARLCAIWDTLGHIFWSTRYWVKFALGVIVVAYTWYSNKLLIVMGMCLWPTILIGIYLCRYWGFISEYETYSQYWIDETLLWLELVSYAITHISMWGASPSGNIQITDGPTLLNYYRTRHRLAYERIQLAYERILGTQ